MLYFRLFCVALFVMTSAYGADSGEAEIHRNKAKILQSRMEWAKAADEAKKATELDPENAEGWYLLGSSFEKSANPKAAAAAYRKSLELDPEGSNAAQIRERIAEVELSDEKKEEKPAPPKVSTPPARPEMTLRPVEEPQLKSVQDPSMKLLQQSGISLGFSPIYRPKVRHELGSSLGTDFDFGFVFSGIITVGLRYASGTVRHIFLPDDTMALNAVHRLYSLYMLINIPLNMPHGSFGPFMGFIPLYLGFHLNSVKAREIDHGNVGGDLGTGLGVRAYVLSDVLSADVMGLYHLGFPAWGVRKDSLSSPLKGPGGGNVTGSVTGFELRLGLNVYF